jgi:hypothetical protein
MTAAALSIPRETPETLPAGREIGLGEVLHTANVHHIDFYRRNQQRRFLTRVSLAALPILALLGLWLW